MEVNNVPPVTADLRKSSAFPALLLNLFEKADIISFTGHIKNSPVANLSTINFWVDRKAYNFIENTHQVWLLTICDLIIGKREYPATDKK